MIITDALGRIEWVNKSFTRITEYTLDEVIGRTPGSVLQGAGTDQATVEYMRAQIRKGEGFQVEILNYAKSGGAYWLAIEVHPVLDLFGQLTHFIGIECDITERKKSEAIEQEREEKG